MKRVMMCLCVFALAAFVFSAPALASSQDAKDSGEKNLTEGQIEEQGYEKRADLVKDLKQKVQVVQDELDRLGEEVKDSELKESFVNEMKKLANEAGDVVDQMQEASADAWPALQEKATEIMNKLEAFVEKLEKELTK